MSDERKSVWWMAWLLVLATISACQSENRSPPPSPGPSPGTGFALIDPEGLPRGDSRDSRPGEAFASHDAVRVIGLSAGGQTTCALYSDGTVACWGSGPAAGAPALSTSLPYRVREVDGAVEVSTGGGHSCARLESGEAVCWGLNFSGQLGVRADGMDASQFVGREGSEAVRAVLTELGVTTPRVVRVPGLPAVDEIVAGHDLTYARAGSQLWTWGGALQRAPQPIDGASNVVRLLPSRRFPCGILEDSSVKCWPIDSRFQWPELSGLVSAQAGSDHACAVLDDGQVRCWGRNDFGEVGVPVSQRLVDATTAVPGLTDATQVTVGEDHSCALRADGTVSCWGRLAHASRPRAEAHVPMVIEGVSDVIRLVAGTEHTCGLTRTGSVTCWGSDESGELGHGLGGQSLTPPSLERMEPARLLASGPHQSCAVTSNDRLVCWSLAEDCADRHRCQPLTSHNAWMPVAESWRPVALDGVLLPSTDELVVGDRHLCMRTSAGRVGCWGDATRGRLGSPTGEIDGLEPMVALSAGRAHTCGLSQSGGVWCWGANDHGQLGDGSRRDGATPVQVGDLRPARQVSAGGEHTCVVLREGGVRCWGGNDLGQVGIPSAGEDVLSPTAPVGATRLADQVAAGNGLTCVGFQDGDGSCWGVASSARLSVVNRALSQRTSPDQPLAPIAAELLGTGLETPQPLRSSTERLVELAAGGLFACGLDSAGQAHCAGILPSAGLLAQGLEADVFEHLGPARHIAVGTTHACAIRVDDSLACQSFATSPMSAGVFAVRGL